MRHGERERKKERHREVQEIYNFGTKKETIQLI